ncbi:MAG: hypothetical protein R3F05_19830 [Planctomycetota bacterium]
MRPRHLVLAMTATLLLPACGEKAQEKAKEVGHTIGEGRRHVGIPEGVHGGAEGQSRGLLLAQQGLLAERQFEKAKAKSADWSRAPRSPWTASGRKVQETYAKAKDATGEGGGHGAGCLQGGLIDAFKSELEKHDK